MGRTVLALAGLGLALLPGTASAQRVYADISIRHGPVEARIITHPHPYYYGYPAPVIVVTRLHRDRAWFHRHGFRVARAWYDNDADRYYADDWRGSRGLREVVVYQRDGRMYRGWDRDDGWRDRDDGWRDQDDARRERRRGRD
jgi:hypothetical protein